MTASALGLLWVAWMAPAVQIPHEQFVLANGLVVILHEDHRVPLVAVDVTYAVGSGDEPPGRTGFAHLFEHLMFMGTTRAPRGAFDAWMEAEGAWSNAWTSEDSTEYLAVGPTHVLPLLLWLEADRMEALGGQIDQAKLDLQRDVVRNERREAGENTPYGVVDLKLPEALYRTGHPYHHPVIGSHEDLQAATVDDVRAFFARWYVPGNASLVVAGDFEPAKVRPLIERWFGGVPAGPAPRSAVVRAAPPGPPALATMALQDRVDQPRLVFAWQSPAAFAPGDADLSVLADVLSDERTGRLYDTLVHESGVARELGAEQRSLQRSSQFVLWATPREGIAPDRFERVVREAVERALRELTDDEVLRARTKAERVFVEELQTLRTRAGLLNYYYWATGDAGAVGRDLDRYRAVTRSSVRAAAEAVLRADRRVTMWVHPAPEVEE